MPPIPIFTSIPPAISRISDEGVEIGSEYQAACIASWKDSGFTPVTINSNAEILSAHVVTEASVSRLKRDATSLYGKPFPFVNDFFEEISSSWSGVVAITNSDILTRFSVDQQRAVRIAA